MDCKPDGFNNGGGMILTDKESFCEHIRLCEKAMYSLAFSIVKNDSDAGEIISKSIYRAYRNLKKIKNENESINEWLITNGCDNEIALGYLAYEVSEKIDLLKVLKRADLSDEEFKGICSIMEGLIAKK